MRMRYLIARLRGTPSWNQVLRYAYYVSLGMSEPDLDGALRIVLEDLGHSDRHIDSILGVERATAADVR